MLHLLQPTGLLALLALALPVLLHLWRPPARTIRIGSLRFLQAGPRSRLRNLHWRERLLLAARLGLLALLALLVAKPTWRHPTPTQPQRWALLSSEGTLTGAALARWRILAASGYETRQLTAGFPRMDWSSSSGDGTQPPTDTWSLLREADARLPAGSSVAVFTSGRVAALRGERPTMQRCQVEWITTPEQVPPAMWLESVALVNPSRSVAPGKLLRVTLGFSDAAATRFAPLDVPAAAGRVKLPVDVRSVLPGAASSSLIEVTAEPGDNFAVRLVPAPTDASGTVRAAWVQATTVPLLNVTILHAPDRLQDARYVEAAIQAAAQIRGQEVAVRVRGNGGEADAPGAAPAPSPDWVFWLDDRPAPAGFARLVAEHGGQLVCDGAENSSQPADGKANEKAASWLVAAPGTPGADSVNVAPQRLWRRTPLRPDHGAFTTLWTDGFGAPLWSVARLGTGQRWDFASRFHPAWNDLPRTTALPAFLGALVFSADRDEPAADATRDQRRADAEQSRPAQAPANTAPPAPLAATAPPPAASVDETDLHGACWLLAGCLFCLERWLSRRSTFATAPGQGVPASHGQSPLIAAAVSRP